jgi:hypothetical protein
MQLVNARGAMMQELAELNAFLACRRASAHADIASFIFFYHFCFLRSHLVTSVHPYVPWLMQARDRLAEAKSGAGCGVSSAPTVSSVLRCTAPASDEVLR